jgi:YidC/Oxa1 family membrane protein insertase
MQAIQPEISRIRKEIKDQQEQGKALMALYKKEGVSPFGSCLPLLIQFPIVIVLYRVFQAGVNESHFNLLYSFTPHPEKINQFFLGVNLSKPDLWVLPILAGASQFVLSYLMAQKIKNNKIKAVKPATGTPEFDPMQMMNKQMIYFFPLITVFFARSMPSAVAIYWIVTTVFGIFQQIYVNNKIRNEELSKAELEEVVEEADEIAEKYIEESKVKSDVETAIPSKKKDFLTKMMNKRLDKQEKKTGVEVTIRKKN